MQENNPELNEIFERIAKLYRHPKVNYMKWFYKNKPENKDEIPKTVQRVMDATPAYCHFHHVQTDYYDTPLWNRMLILQAPSMDHLCKTIVFVNTRWSPEENLLEPINSKYYCVLVQYTDKLNTQKLINYVKGLKNLSKKYYNLRVAEEEEATQLTGFTRNAVSPFGMLSDIPVIMTENMSRLTPPVAFLGAGHIDWKVAIPLQDIKATIVDLS